jgi:hypothetical protein
MVDEVAQNHSYHQTLFTIYQPVRLNVLEDPKLYHHCCDNLSYLYLAIIFSFSNGR